MSRDDGIVINAKSLKVYYLTGDGSGELRGKGKSLEDSIFIAQNIIDEVGEPEYGIRFINLRTNEKKQS